jgi:uncharacterized lipoprotein YajG
MFLAILLLSACARKPDETPVVPPETYPLSLGPIGYGVISVSYTHVEEEPREGSAAQGYLRQGSLVKVIERRSVNDRGKVESWVLVEGQSKGWIKEVQVTIYGNEEQARTAAGTYAETITP